MGVHLNFWRTLNPSCHKNHSKYPILVYSNFLKYIFSFDLTHTLVTMRKSALLTVHTMSEWYLEEWAISWFFWQTGAWESFHKAVSIAGYWIQQYAVNRFPFWFLHNLAIFLFFILFACNQLTGTKAIQNIEPNDWIKHKTCSYIHCWAQRPFSAPMRQRYGAYSAAN